MISYTKGICIFWTSLFLLISSSLMAQGAPSPTTPPAATPPIDKQMEVAADSQTKPADPADSRPTALVSNMVLKVLNPEEVRIQLKEELKKLGGFAVLVTDDTISFRVPPSRLTEALALIARHGMTLEKSIEREDLTSRIATLQGQLKSRLEVLYRLRTFFDGADFSSTLEIENSMTALVNEIEDVKGQLRVAQDQARYARIHISFRFETRDRLVYTRSPFEWLNTVSIDTVLEEF